jgi:hypothetical protein
MEKSTATPREGRPPPSALQIRLNPNFENEQPQPSPRSQSLDSHSSLEDIEVCVSYCYITIPPFFVSLLLMFVFEK